MHGGILGIIIYGFLEVLFLSLIDKLGKSLKLWIVLSIMIKPVFDMYLSSDLVSVLLTDGLILCFIILFLNRNTKLFKNENNY